MTKAHWQEAIQDIQDKFLDDVFDVSAKIKREEFIRLVTNKQSYVFKPQEIRKRVREQLAKL